MSKVFTLDELLQNAIEIVVKEMKADMGSIFLFEKDSSTLIMRAESGYKKSLLIKQDTRSMEKD